MSAGDHDRDVRIPSSDRDGLFHGVHGLRQKTSHSQPNDDAQEDSWKPVFRGYDPELSSSHGIRDILQVD